LVFHYFNQTLGHWKKNWQLILLGRYLQWTWPHFDDRSTPAQPLRFVEPPEVFHFGFTFIVGYP
jgi:hypothetical protein